MAERIVPQRFLDAGEEPDQTLTPIEGYEKYPLVSLKEAVEPIKSLLHNADSMIEIAKRNSRKPTDGLTPDESSAIHLYTMQWPKPHPSLYTILNQKLRTKDRDTLISWFLFLKLFFTALYKLPSLKGVIFRGVRGNISDQYDEDHFWWGASSCTETMNAMETFVGSEGDRTIFNIECFNGKSIQAHSYFKEENEILLMPGSYFQIVSKWKDAKGLYIIHLREKVPPYQTMAPPFDLSSSSKITTSVEQLTISTEKKSIASSKTASGEPQTVSPLRGSSIDIHPNAKWQKNGLTVAGGNGQGNGINQLSHPLSLYVDDDQTVYVADQYNHRIVEWKWGATSGQVVAGGNGSGSGAHQLSNPRDVIVNKERDSLIICDCRNSRVVRWPRRSGTSGETIISNIDGVGLTMDENGSLYVTDAGKHEVRRYRRGESEGTVVAGGNGSGNRLDQLSSPRYVFVDRDHSVYVSDERNHRVMKWVEGAKQGIVVAGGQGEGNGLTQLYYPEGVVVDQLGTVYVAEYGNARIMRWVKGATQGSVIVGGNGEGGQSNQLNGPFGLSFDRHGNLYVINWGNHRVQKFNIDSNG